MVFFQKPSIVQVVVVAYKIALTKFAFTNTCNGLGLNLNYIFFDINTLNIDALKLCDIILSWM